MKTVFKAISRENLNDIPEPCRFCLYWESPEDFEELLQKKRPQLAAKKKREWFVQTLRDFGDCGKIVYQNGMPVGYAQYAPVSRLRQATNYKSNPPGR